MNGWINVVPWILTLISIVIALIALVHNFHKDDVQENIGTHENLIKANVKLDELCRNVNEIRLDNRSLLTRIESVEKHQAVLERDLKTVFNLIDELKGGR